MAFTPFLPTSTLRTTRPTSVMFHHEEVDAAKIKKAGAGVAIKPPGDFSSFDPDQDGKLQGTGNCNERISLGAAYGGKTSQPAPAPAPVAGFSGSNLTKLIDGLKTQSQY